MLEKTRTVIIFIGVSMISVFLDSDNKHVFKQSGCLLQIIIGANLIFILLDPNNKHIFIV